jgi:hypothetical protein
MKNPSNQLNETISNHHMYPEITIDIQEKRKVSSSTLVEKLVTHH